MLSGFDEDVWPCTVFFEDDYLARCLDGRRLMRRSRAVIGVLARDVSQHLPATIANIERAAAMFGDCRVVVFENDSCDDTREQLCSWRDRDSRVILLTQDLGKPKWGSIRDRRRTADLAWYRTQVQAHIANHCADFDYVLLVDADLQGWSLDGLANTFGQQDWDVVGANGLCLWHGRPLFIDTWAMRTLHHPAHHDSKHVNLAVLPRGMPMQPVRSCFGGLAAYAMPAFLAGRYDGADCEHVTFHASLREAGHGRIFLNPSMIVLYPPYEALYPRAGAPWSAWLELEPEDGQHAAAPLSHPRVGDHQTIYLTRPTPFMPQADFELHMLLTERDVLRALWSLKSLADTADLAAKLVLHDDGSLSATARAQLRHHFPGCEIQANSDPAVERRLAKHPLCRAFRQRNVIARRLLDMPLLAQAGYIVSAAADLLWFRQDPEVMRCISQRLPFSAGPTAGLVGYAPELLDLDFLESALADLVRDGWPTPRILVRTLHAMLLGRDERTRQLGAATADGMSSDSPAFVHFDLDEYGQRGFFRVGADRLIRAGFLERNGA